MEKTLDMIADAILGVFSWVFKWFGDTDEVKSVQEKVVALCGFLPTATSVAAMLGAPGAAITGVSAIATAICQAVSATRVVTLANLKSAGYGTVNGVPIEGDWIKGN